MSEPPRRFVTTDDVQIEQLPQELLLLSECFGGFFLFRDIRADGHDALDLAFLAHGH